MMGVVHGHAVHQPAAAQDPIPDFLETWCAAASFVVHLRMPVEDLEQPRALDLLQFFGRHRPCEVRVIDVRNAVRFPDAVHALLHHLENGRPRRRGDQRRQVQPVDVDRLGVDRAGHFFAADHQELVRRAVQRVQAVNGREVVVIRQHQKLIAVLPVPPHDLVWRAVAVAVQGVGMRVALVPAQRRPAGGCRLLCVCRNHRGKQKQGAGKKKDPRLGHDLIEPPCR
jgi:hypothetical protein